MQVSLTLAEWRMVRTGLGKGRFRFADVREMRRADRDVFDWLVENGFFVPAGDAYYELTPKAVAAADLGFYEWEPPKPVVEVKAKARRGKK